MSLKDRIRELNRTEDAEGLRRLADSLRAGRFRTRDGLPVLFDYNSTRELFERCDPSIDAGRFEELMQLADYASGN